MAHRKLASFDLREVATALFKFEGIHDGRWQLEVDFSVTNAHVGTDDQGALPGLMMLIRGMRLHRRDDAPEGTPQVFDAAKENPRE